MCPFSKIAKKVNHSTLLPGSVGPPGSAGPQPQGGGGGAVGQVRRRQVQQCCQVCSKIFTQV